MLSCWMPDRLPLNPCPHYAASKLEMSRLIKTKGGVSKQVRQATDLAGGKEQHLLICELVPFDLKINKSK